MCCFFLFIFTQKQKRFAYDYEWFPNVTELIAHLSFQDEAVGMIFVETMDSTFARTIGIIGHEFSSKHYILVDPFSGIAIRVENLDCDVQHYLAHLKVPDTTGFTYCSITQATPPPPQEMDNSVGGESVETTMPASVTKKREYTTKKRTGVAAPSRKKAAVAAATADTSDK